MFNVPYGTGIPTDLNIQGPTQMLLPLEVFPALPQDGINPFSHGTIFIECFL